MAQKGQMKVFFKLLSRSVLYVFDVEKQHISFWGPREWNQK